MAHVWVDESRQKGDRKVRTVRGFPETHVHGWGGALGLEVRELLQSLDYDGGVFLCSPGTRQMDGDQLLWDLCALRVQDVVGGGQVL